MIVKLALEAFKRIIASLIRVRCLHLFYNEQTYELNTIIKLTWGIYSQIKVFFALIVATNVSSESMQI